MPLRNDEQYVFCPLVNQKIAEDLCDDVAFASEGTLPIEYAPKKFQVKDWKEICRECKNHPN